MLNRLILTDAATPFDALQGQTFQDYEIFRNDSRCLSIRFNWEGCGAYCENYEVYFSFDSNTGDELIADDLFTPNGYGAVKKMITAERQQSLTEEIESEKEQLEKIREGNATNDSDSTTLKEQIEMYEDCSQRRNDSDIEYDKIYLGDSAVWFVAGRCSNHAMRAIDDLYDFYNRVPVYNHINLLSEYGKQFFTLTSKQVSHPRKFKIYEGTINNKYPILFFENALADGTQYSYCYKKYGTMIDLENISTAETIQLEERDPNGNRTGTLNLKREGRKFVGTYYNSGSGKSMRFEVMEKN